MFLLKSRVALLFLIHVIKHVKKPSDIIQILKMAKENRHKIKKLLFFKKVVYINGKYHWDLYNPGFPSPSFINKLNLGIEKALGLNEQRIGLLIIAITKKCSLSCEHCFEWNEINKKDTLTEDTINEKISYYLKGGNLGQVFFSGGEPLNRYKTLISVLEKNKGTCEFWLISSGLSLDYSKANQLKNAGLTGIIFSLDDFDRKRHDKFRGFNGSYNSVIKAIDHANKQGLVTALSLCPQKNTLSRSFLDSYMSLARSLNVCFVQILEPRAEGRFENKDVILKGFDLKLLETFYFSYNNKRIYKDFPKVFYPDYDKRIFGCKGMNRYAYIDTNGNIQPCPFCKQVCSQDLHSHN